MGNLPLIAFKQASSGPKLKVKGAAARGIIGFALKLATEQLDSDCVLIMRRLARFVDLLDSEGMFLSESARVELPQLGMRLCKTYAKLATKALGIIRRLGSHRQSCICSNTYANGNPFIFSPRLCWRYNEKDLVGQLTY